MIEIINLKLTVPSFSIVDLGFANLTLSTGSPHHFRVLESGAFWVSPLVGTNNLSDLKLTAAPCLFALGFQAITDNQI